MAVDNNNEVKMPKEILPEDVELEAQDLNPSEDVDIQMLEDGGAIVDFDPQQGAMQGGAVPPSTVIEKIITQNAAQENAPAMNKMNVGVASAPINSNMYSRGMAGGGIVAFQEGGLKKFRSSPFEIEAALRGGLLSETTANALKNRSNITNVTRIIDPSSGEVDF